MLVTVQFVSPQIIVHICKPYFSFADNFSECRECNKMPRVKGVAGETVTVTRMMKMKIMMQSLTDREVKSEI